MNISKGKLPFKAICTETEFWHENVTVKLTHFPDSVEVMYQKNRNKGGQFGITKLTKDTYKVNATGEIKEFVFGENRKDNIDSLRKTFKKIRNIINCNFHGGDNELMFTGTYAENMTDTKRLYDDFRKFMQRLKYRYGKVEYMSIVEPQARGAWHVHVLLKFIEVEKIYIPNEDISALWGQGFTTVRRIRKDVDNLGAYLSAYLGDIEVTDDVDVSELIGDRRIVEYKTVEVEGQKKKIIKGGRLHLYPSGMNIYRCSRGIKQPVIEEVEAGNYMPLWDDNWKPSYVSAVNIFDDDGVEINKIIYETYKLNDLKNESE